MNLPCDDASSGWYRILPEPSPPLELTQDIKADFAVVGAGFAGLSAARQLALNHPEAVVILIDAQSVGEGASGRNSGFAIDLPHKFALENPDKQFKQRLLRLNRSAIEQLDLLVKQFKIDCYWSAAGKYQGAVGERGQVFLSHFANLMDQLGEPYEWVKGEQLDSVLGTSYYREAIYTPGGYLMQPAALVRGLARHLPENVRLFENSPVLEWGQEPTKGCFLRTAKAKVLTDKLIFTTSIYTREFGFLKNRLLPIATFASLTRPLNEAEQATFTGQYNWGLTPADHAGTTLRMTADKRIIVRNTYRYAPRYGKSISQSERDKIARSHAQSFLRRYPQFGHVPFEYTWGGTYAISRNFTNFFGQLAPNVYASACDNGVGVTWGTISGRLLADLACGKNSDLLADIQAVTGMPSLNPPEPLSAWGARSRIFLAARQSQGEL
ncbi:FAD-binding oxidoreductase [Paenalcaligenes niemegkensis]|uniref:NAD(P)/FAD-dependent oxidoreductase n=1 Tax=Paenalcaligenes niemegkensis TaxID=2895469 RepID=UPI001EE8AB8E|nr:FAD-binding oxidoreductase [Paenalcaligenes niemegkensis]MCQ9617673.1 FAD-binding oxidoreductase [Paenalcaligenes niemegkensis]